jgi:hypothetical protein
MNASVFGHSSQSKLEFARKSGMILEVLFSRTSRFLKWKNFCQNFDVFFIQMLSSWSFRQQNRLPFVFKQCYIGVVSCKTKSLMKVEDETPLSLLENPPSSNSTSFPTQRLSPHSSKQHVKQETESWRSAAAFEHSLNSIRIRNKKMSSFRRFR